MGELQSLEDIEKTLTILHFTQFNYTNKKKKVISALSRSNKDEIQKLIDDSGVKDISADTFDKCLALFHAANIKISISVCTTLWNSSKYNYTHSDGELENHFWKKYLDLNSNIIYFFGSLHEENRREALKWVQKINKY